jgi:PRTRC genetic system ThiF family protein
MKLRHHPTWIIDERDLDHRTSSLREITCQVIGHETDILIGCVDSRAARNAMTRTQTYWNCHYWLDLGNNADSGQFVLGQPENQRNKARDSRLPTAPELFPELINVRLDKKDKLPPCSALEALERQEPLVNQTLAYQALAMLARLFRYGSLSYHGGFVNLRTGRTTSLPVEPVLWQRMRMQSSGSEYPGSRTQRTKKKVVRP